jgi:hypothetical protein
MPVLSEYKDLERLNLEGNQISIIENVSNTLLELNLKENR